jgi:hypothetical protein
MTEELWLALASSFGPILREAFPDAPPSMRAVVGEMIANEVRKRESWFKGDAK